MSGVVDTFHLPATIHNVKYTLAYPYLDIHFNSSIIFSCLIDNSLLECSQLPITPADVKDFRGISTAGYQLWTKILIRNKSVSRIFIYSHTGSHCLQLHGSVYSATQINNTIFVWASNGVYSYTHGVDIDLQFIVDWPYKPNNKRTCLVYVNDCLLFVTDK
jgi:hypothetical protein